MVFHEWDPQLVHKINTMATVIEWLDDRVVGSLRDTLIWLKISDDVSWLQGKLSHDEATGFMRWLTLENLDILYSLLSFSIDSLTKSIADWAPIGNGIANITRVSSWGYEGIANETRIELWLSLPVLPPQE